MLQTTNFRHLIAKILYYWPGLAHKIKIRSFYPKVYLSRKYRWDIELGLTYDYLGFLSTKHLDLYPTIVSPSGTSKLIGHIGGVEEIHLQL